MLHPLCRTSILSTKISLKLIQIILQYCDQIKYLYFDKHIAYTNELIFVPFLGSARPDRE